MDPVLAGAGAGAGAGGGRGLRIETDSGPVETSDMKIY